MTTLFKNDFLLLALPEVFLFLSVRFLNIFHTTKAMIRISRNISKPNGRKDISFMVPGGQWDPMLHLVGL